MKKTVTLPGYPRFLRRLIVLLVVIASLTDLGWAASWSTTGNLDSPRRAHTATRLNDGRVLIVGGLATSSNSLQSAELFDPATGTFTPTGSLNTARDSHSATLLADGRVLVAGGFTRTAERFDFATGTFTATAELSIGRTAHTANRLDNGQVLVAEASTAHPYSAEG
jgi:hypothetical protein